MANAEELADAVDSNMDKVRQKCLSRGKSGMMCFSSVFRRFDKDYSKQISFSEFQEGLRLYDIKMSEEQEQDLFSQFDQDSSGTVDFQEFVIKLSPPLSGKRLQVAKYVFEQLDSSGDGILQIDDLTEKFSEKAKRHSKYISGEWTVSDVLQNLLSGFAQPDSKNGVVTIEEFLNYYSTVSMCVQDDAYFEQHLKACWGVK